MAGSEVVSGPRTLSLVTGNLRLQLALGPFLCLEQAEDWRVIGARRSCPARHLFSWQARTPVRGTLEPPTRSVRFLVVGDELAGDSPYGNRCNSVGVGGQFLASAPRACKQWPCGGIK